MSIIEIHGLSKEYRRLGKPPVVAVDNLSLTIDQPGVHGFLGPNGSGKTTTIRCLLSLVRPTSGHARVLGAEVSTQLHTVIDRVGALVESPKFFGPYSARRNLDLLAGVSGASPTDIERALETVGLSDRADDSFKSFSLGMKQRLAVAATLLKNPDLIILDEPANGLDPQGIRDMRDLVRALGDDGRAVFVSSHQLAEIQAVCDTVTIVQEGRLVVSGSVAELTSGATAGGVAVRIAHEHRDQAIAVLTNAGATAAAMFEPDRLSVAVDPSEAAWVSYTLATEGLYLSEMTAHSESLEDVFLSLTSAASPGRPPDPTGTASTSTQSPNPAPAPSPSASASR